ncbi:MAG: hypothetical protein IJY40_01915 [Oscillospiraceae bacterium]|nr:hypothetical protein [Oscillospiraceae bacterium]
MKRSTWLRLIAVILIISMLAVPVSAATVHNAHSNYGLIGTIIGFIRDIIRDIFDDWFDDPGHDPDPTVPAPTPTEPVVTEPTPPGTEDPTDPSAPVETDPTDPSEPVETDPTDPSDPAEPSEPKEYETTLELVEDQTTIQNGHMLRGVTYVLTNNFNPQPVTAQSALRNAANALRRNPAAALSLNAVTVQSTTVSYTLTTGSPVSELVPGTYVIVNTRSGKLVTNDPASAGAAAGSGSGLSLSGTIADTISANAVWEISGTNGSYTVKDQDGNYMTIGNNSAGVTAAATTISLNYSSNWTISQDGAYLNDFGGSGTCAAGWNGSGASTDPGSQFALYAVTTTEPEQPEVPDETKLVYYPVTMFNYDMDTMNDMTMSMYEEGSTLYSGIHFSNGSPGGNVTYAVTAHTGEYTNGQYVIQNYLMKDYSQPSWLSFSPNGDKGIIANADQADAAIWTLTRVPGANNFTLTTELDGTTYYMTLGNETSGVTTEYTEVTLVLYPHTNAGIQITKDGYYLGHSEGNLFCGNTNSTSTSNGMGFFPVAEDGTIGDTARNVTTINGAVTSGFSRWNWWSYLEDGNAAQNKFFAELVQHELDANGDIVFNVPEPGIFKTGTGENIAQKDVYEYVGLPFVLSDDGVYTFDSDTNGVYFDGAPASGTAEQFNLMKFDAGNPQGWDGMYYGDGSTNLWAPFNTNTNDTSEGAIDYHFGMRADIPFSMTPNGRVKSTDDNSKPITFTFAGDDDVWVFIDGHLVIDLGGIHNRIGATINFADNTITYFLPESNNNGSELGCYNDRTRYPVVVDEKGNQTITVKLYNDANGMGALGKTRTDFAASEKHEMSIFYMERGQGTSNCHIEFNLPMRDTLSVTKKANQSWSQAQDDLDGDSGDGTTPLTAREQAAVNKLNFGFTLYKKEAGAENFVPVSSTNYYLQDAAGNVKDILSTDANGHFYLKNGETAKFMTEMSGNGVSYYVVEDKTPEGFLTPDFQYKGFAAKGFNWIDDLGVSHDDLLDDAAGIPEQVIPVDATKNYSYIVTAFGSIESIDSLEFVCVNYLNHELPNPTALAMEDTIVIDYGLPVLIDPLANDVFRGDNIEIIAWGDENLELHKTYGEDSFLSSYEIKNAVMVGEDSQTYQPTFRFGSVEFIDTDYHETLDGDLNLTNVERDTFKYTLTEQLTEVEVISYVIKVNSTSRTTVDDEIVHTETKTDIAVAKVYIVPATIMYYEENFGDLIQLLPSDGEFLADEINTTYVSAFQEPGVVGEDSNSTYGSDVAYLHDSEDSNGTSMHFDTTNGYVRFQYTFTGTGTTFFARTAADTGYMQVLLFKGVMQPDENGGIGHYSGKQMATYYRDTYFEDTEKLLPNEGNTLYNIPVYTTDGLDYGTYTVVVTVAKENTPGAGPADVAKTNPSKHTCHNEHGEEIVVAKNTAGHICCGPEGEILYTNGSGDQFYLDGIRIMRPLDENSSVDLVDRALDAYETDGETNLDVVTLRQKLITDVEDGEIDWSKEQFVMLTDTNGNLVKPEDYITIGPKEEVYLAKGQTVSFALKFWQPDGLKLYMGMKAPFGEASLNIGHNPYPLYNTVDSYYDVTNDYETLTLVEEQIVDTEGNGLYYDSEDTIYIKVVNPDKTYYFCDEEYNVVTIEDESELKPLMQEYYVVTYTFTATSHIVSLTNIKVVGSHEFTIIPGYDIHIPGSNGGTDTDAPTPEEEVQP